MTQDQQRTSTRQGPSPIFLGLLAVAAASGWLLWIAEPSWGIGAGIVTFVFVTTAWVVTLCLHEFGHALVAYRNGDLSVAHRGYLTLDPLRYTHAVFSIVLPILFLLLGGIGLPGGAVFIDRRALRSRAAQSGVSAAGPLVNLAVAIVLALAFWIGWGARGADALYSGGLYESGALFWVAVAFLLFLQVTAAILNLLPVPGLDGYGIIEPYLPRPWAARAARIAPYAVLGLFALLWIPAVNGAFFSAIYGLVALLGVPGELVGVGHALYQFWLLR
jgi:Zn-dependent protease